MVSSVSLTDEEPPRRKPLRVGIVAGEASGDTLGAGLIEAIKARRPDAEFVGVAGPRMIEAGCEPWNHSEELSVMGLSEVLWHLPRLLKLRRKLLDRLMGANLDVFVGIDSPDFNLPVEAVLKRAGIPTIQYVSPQVWAWRQSRVSGVRRAADEVLCLLPFETRFYEQHGVAAKFVGHPLADDVPMEPDRQAARAALELSATRPCLALLPGSRASEVVKLARPFLETAQWLSARHPSLQTIVGLANESTRTIFSAETAGLELDPPAKLYTGRAREVMAAADVVLTASGTASLEVLLTKRPMVVAYRISGVTHRLLRLMGLSQLEFFSLPNLLAGKRVVPEFLQGDVRSDVLGPELEAFLRAADEPPRRGDWYDVFRTIHQQLQRNASAGAADAVLELLGNETTNR